MTAGFKLLRRQLIRAPLPEVVAFFAEAANLQHITPGWLGFRIAEGGGVPVGPGTRLVYRLRLFGLPLRWVTVIERFHPQVGFVDVQVEGPYRRWVHVHLFTPLPAGVLMEDRVDYQLSFGPLGAVAQPLIALQLAAIFRHRYRVIEERFSNQS